MLLSLWGNTCPTMVNKAQVIMNSAARMVLNKKKSTKQTILMDKCNWLNLTETIEYQSLVQLFKTLRWNSPVRLSSQFSTEEDGIVTTSQPRLLLTSRAWRHKTTVNWNNLPNELRIETINITKFKTKLKRWIRDRREVLQMDGTT